MVLDLDGSVTPPSGAGRLDLRQFEEKVRYYAAFKSLTTLEAPVLEALKTHRVFFLGSGDFHHLSWLIIKLLPAALGIGKVQVVIFDNHPDNMFFPSGIHCGSWVYHASKLPNVSKISVYGIASRDLEGIDLFQNRFSVIKSGKVKYYCLTPVSKLAKMLSGSNIDEITTERKSLAEIIRREVDASGDPVYLSVDKDVFAPSVVKTTWDQGRLEQGEVLKCLTGIAVKAVAADICGDTSFYAFKSSIKNLARRIDGFDKPDSLPGDRKKHESLNLKILSAIKNISC